MEKLRKLIIFLILGLAFLMNIERLDLGETNLIDISTFVYVLGVVAVIGIISLQKVIPVPLSTTAFLVFTVYIILKLYIFNRHPFLGGIHTYVSITEVSLLVLLVALAYRLAELLTEFEEIVQNLILPNTGRRVVNMDDAIERVKSELAMSRRHERPLSIIVAEPSVDSLLAHRNRIIEEISQSIAARYLSKTMAKNLSEIIRRPDIVIEQTGQNRFIILCMQTGSDGLDKLLDRIHSITNNDPNGVSVKCGVASFPQDAVTFEELVKKAESHLNSREAN